MVFLVRGRFSTIGAYGRAARPYRPTVLITRDRQPCGFSDDEWSESRPADDDRAPPPPVRTEDEALIDAARTSSAGRYREPPHIAARGATPAAQGIHRSAYDTYCGASPVAPRAWRSARRWPSDRRHSNAVVLGDATSAPPPRARQQSIQVVSPCASAANCSTISRADERVNSSPVERSFARVTVAEAAEQVFQERRSGCVAPAGTGSDSPGGYARDDP